jgi:hypothetical protein
LSSISSFVSVVVNRRANCKQWFEQRQKAGSIYNICHIRNYGSKFVVLGYNSTCAMCCTIICLCQWSVMQSIYVCHTCRAVSTTSFKYHLIIKNKCYHREKWADRNLLSADFTLASFITDWMTLDYFSSYISLFLNNSYT